jgi:hypothetical protein
MVEDVLYVSETYGNNRQSVTLIGCGRFARSHQRSFQNQHVKVHFQVNGTQPGGCGASSLCIAASSPNKSKRGAELLEIGCCSLCCTTATVVLQ